MTDPEKAKLVFSETNHETFVTVSDKSLCHYLTDDELDRVQGRRTELAGLLQQKYGKAREEAEKEIDAWMAKH